MEGGKRKRLSIFNYIYKSGNKRIKREFQILSGQKN